MRAASERTQSAPKEPTRAATGSTQALSHPKKVETPLSRRPNAKNSWRKQFPHGLVQNIVWFGECRSSSQRGRRTPSGIERHDNEIAVPSFILSGARVGAPDGMKLGTLMLLLSR